ncbi:hypothetical protein AMJ44_06710 [candidate division WOR-1 bacterium DG_54_3]|jgi:arsenite methyltransferase|uniref:Methyltransferase domain-containing protein n=1 Tax=candidate division WOR-1 bacterium DG_54_3 TaxID=1703775 RepID=A0A0S7Y0R8_UNCSA|nr:MAG: hypothetical protein AMJ44_06710 [candidate division WOR-1 bacterium DG_54_3]
MCRAEMFNKRAASPKSKPDEILKALDLRAGQKVADIGSGGGYYTLRFAAAVGAAGEVFAVDTKQAYLDFIRKAAAERSINNVKYILIGKDSLPDAYLDLIFFRNVYHHLEERVALMKAYKPKLKPGGRIAIIEYLPGKGGFFSYRRLFGHHVPKEKIIAELEQAGYQKITEYDFLAEQSFTIFQKNEP